MTDQKPFKIKLHPLLDEKTLNAISDATLAAINDQLVVPQLELTPDNIGKDIKGEGIYLGTYAPVDRDGVSLKKVFNVFAAPEDLPGIKTYDDTVTYLSSLKNWHGHDGDGYASNEALYTALRNDYYNGGWIIPTRDILHGRDVDNNKSTPDNILAHKNKGAFQGTFKKALAKTSDYSCWYWSSTEPREDSSSLFAVHFGRNIAGLDKKNSLRLSCRPVRLVPIK